MHRKADVPELTVKSGGLRFLRLLSNVSSQLMKVFSAWIDANAATGPRAFPHVGDHDDGVTASTNLLRDFLYFQDLCLPASHPIHRGSRTTWFSPDGQHECRIDYVVVPCNLLPYCTFSCVLPDFDLGTVHLDHLMSALQLSWQTWQQVSASGDTSTKPRYDRRSLQRGSLTSVLCQQAANDWTDDIDTTCGCLYPEPHVSSCFCAPTQEGLQQKAIH